MSKTNNLNYLSTYSSKSSTINAKYSIWLFLQSLYSDGNLEELIDRYFNEDRDINEDLQTFFCTIKTRSPASIRNLLSGVNIFHMENDREIPQRFLKRLKRRIRGIGARTRDKVPTTEEMKQILLQMGINGQALYLTRVSSGARIGEILKCV